jgi:hypothetical protein
MMGIQVYSNEGPNSLQRGIITKVQKQGRVIKIFSHEPQYHKS